MRASVPTAQHTLVNASVRAMRPSVVVVMLATLLGIRHVTLLPLTNGMWFWSVLIALSTWVLVRKYGHQNLAAAT